MENKQANKKLYKGTIIYAIGNFGTKILSFLITLLYTYYISTEDMGDYDLVTTTVSLFTPIITMRISDATYRWLLHDIDKEENCISATYRVIMCGTVLSALIILTINFIVPIKYCYYFIALLILGRWMESLQTLLRGLKRQNLFAISGIFYSAIFLGLNLLFIVIFHLGITGMFLSTIISYTVTITMMLFKEPRLRTKVISSKDNRELTKEMLRYSAPIVPSGLSWWIMGASDRYVIRFLLGSAANGIYAIANKFPTILSMLFTIFNYSWTDVAIGSLKEGKETSEYASHTFENLYKLAFCFTIFLIPATKLITELVLSPSYKSASIYIGYLYLGALFQGFTAFISAGLLQGTNTKMIAKSSTYGAIVNLLVDILLMKYSGIQAASFSTFCGFFVMWIMRVHDTKDVSPIHINLYIFIPLLLISIIVASITIWTSNFADIIILLISTILFVAVNRRYLVRVVKKIRKGK